MAVSAIDRIMTEKPENTPIPPNNLRGLRRARELTMEQLAEQVGTDASTINKLEKSRMRLSDRWIGPLAKALGVTPNDIFDIAEGAPPTVRTDVRPADVRLPDRFSMPNDVPVHGTAAASHLRGAFQLDAGVIDYVRRPPALAGARDAYALYIEGNSMEPRYGPGDLVFIHPHRPARLGDPVIVQVEVAPGDIEASIGFLRKRSPEVVIGKLNPEAQVEIKGGRVVAIHRVLTLNDLFGV